VKIPAKDEVTNRTEQAVTVHGAGLCVCGIGLVKEADFDDR
jgi:hypothetical protein